MQHAEAGELRLALLGDPQITRDGRRVAGFVSGKAQALLAFLAVTGATHSREFLAGLLWAETAEADARASLRVVLSNLRQTIGAEHFTTTRNTVAFNRAAAYALDVETFERLMAAGHATPDDRAHAWRQAVELYRGDLLSGVSVNDAPAFDEWLAARREHLRQLAWRALDGLATVNAERGHFNAAIDDLTRLLALDPWHEDAHRRLMTALLAAGRRNAALLQYEQCRQLLDDELSVEPEPETTALYERIRSGDLETPPAASPHGAPWMPPAQEASASGAPHTSFVGRAGELASIFATLEDPACRLLTLVGPGGIGKSRLVLQVAADRRNRFRNGVHFVPLAPIDAPEHIAPAIAAAIGYPLTGGDAEGQLLRLLRTYELLLVLDNLEHLSDGVPLLSEILNDAPGVKILATSRERLALQAEWLMPIHGLTLPADISPEQINQSSAVQLFAARARQTRPDFALSDDNIASVVGICTLLDGVPLAIELAAAWVRTHTCAEIAAQISESLDFLTSALRDAPRRHRSLRAVFEHSWALLDEPEREIFASLAVFRGGFLEEAAVTVIGASRADLFQLVDKSLLARDELGRYTLHELVRQYAHEQLVASGRLRAVQHRHADHYAAFLEAGAAALKGPAQTETLAAIDAEIDNVRGAWSWAIEQRELSIVERMLEGLALFCYLWILLNESRALLDQAVPVVESSAEVHGADQHRHAVLLGRLLGWRARFDIALGRVSAAEQTFAQASALLDRYQSVDALSYAADTRGMIATSRGRHAEAIELQQHALEVARAAGDTYGEGLALSRLGGITYNAGLFPAAKSAFTQSLAIRQQLGDWDGYIRDLNNVGDVARLMGDTAEARRRLEDALALSRELTGQLRSFLPQLNLAELCIAEGRYKLADHYLQGAIRLGRDKGDQRSMSAIMVIMAELAWHRDGDRATAEALLDECLAGARAHSFMHRIVECLNRRASIAEQAGDEQAAVIAREALQVACDTSNAYQAGLAELVLGRCALRRAADAESECRFESALQQLTQTGARPALLETLVSYAELLSTGPGCPPQHAIQWLFFALRRPATWHLTRTRAEHLLEDLAKWLPPASLAAAQERAATMTFDGALAIAVAP